MIARFYGGPFDGLELPISPNGMVTFPRPLDFPNYYDLARIERTPGPDGIDSEVAVYVLRGMEQGSGFAG